MTETNIMQNRLEVDNLSVAYRTARGWSDALQGVSVAVPGRGIVAIVGESGSGKSTLANAMVGLLPSNARVESGSIQLGDLDVLAASARQLRAIRGTRIGFVPQDPMMSLNPSQRVGRQVAEAITLHTSLPREAVGEKVRALLEDAGLSDPERVASSYPHELSGGMRQRVLIAIAFACNPEIIIADEPTSALDATVAVRILDHLESLVAEHGSTLVIITHDLALAARRADYVAVMSQGKVVEFGTAKEVLDNPSQPYTKALMANSLQLKDRRQETAGDAAGRRSRTGDVAATAPGEIIVRASDVKKTFRVAGGEVPAVRGVSFEIAAGTTLALVGESGSGKSTVARMVLGLEDITDGDVTLYGQSIRGMHGRSLRDVRRRVQMVYQSPYSSLDPRFSVAQIIDEPLRSYGVGDRASRAGRVAELLERVGLPASYARRSPTELSGGQRQRVAIARALAISPDLVICDEPVSALDASVQAQVLDLLLEIQESLGVSYLFISHDLAVVYDIAHQVGVMQQGRLLEIGSADEIFRNPQTEYTSMLLDAAYGRAEAPAS